jgi:hypothetical protein
MFNEWEKREKEDIDTLSEWMKSVRSLIQMRIKKVNTTAKWFIRQ